MNFLNGILRGTALVLTVMSVFILGACGDDDPSGPTLNGNNTVYPLFEVGSSGISGTVTFAELSNGATRIIVDLNGTASGGMHPSHIHMNTAAEGGSIAISLEPIDGATGSSTTDISETDGGTAVSYNQLISFDGYVNVHESETNLATLLAQGDIGQNVLTGESETYELAERSDSGISGTVSFLERLNGETLVEVELTGTDEAGDYPSHIHMNTAAEGGGIAISLNNINGATGLSRTNVTETDASAAVTYDDLVIFNGYVNVHLSPTELGTIVAQGDIGQNALTGSSISYAMGGTATGTATFYERTNGATLIVISLTGFTFTGNHPSHIHAGSIASPGGIDVTLTSVDANGMSKTNVDALNDETPVTYEDLRTYNGYINVHMSPSDLGTLISQGDIGANG